MRFSSRVRNFALPAVLAIVIPITGCQTAATKPDEAAVPPPDEEYAKSLYPEGHYRASGWEVPDANEYQFQREKRISLSERIPGKEVISKSYAHSQDADKQLAIASVDAEGYPDAPFLYFVRDQPDGTRRAFYDTNGDRKFDTKLIGKREIKLPKWVEDPVADGVEPEVPSA